MQLEDIKNIAVVGAGLMGHGIGLAYALGGYRVTLNDLNEAILDRAIANIKSNLEMLQEHKVISKEAISATLSRINTNSNLREAVAQADFVTEAVLEDLELKRKLFKELDLYSPKQAILASNTSSLLISDFGSEVKREGKVVITHWFNPPHLVPVVEIVCGNNTSPETAKVTYALLKKINKIPIRVAKEIPGFLVNRVQMALIREVWSLWEMGIASAEDIDLAIKGSMGLRLASMGPLEICDLGGLDLWFKVAQNLFKEINSSLEPPQLLKEKIERGEKGLKSGRGFFDAKAKWEEKVKERDTALIQMLKLLYWAKGK